LRERAQVRSLGHTDQTAPENEYTPQFKEISENIKRKRNYRCDKCKVDLSDFRNFLHAHHKNGIQSDDRESNIAILCILHHAEQPYHAHMKQLPEYKKFLQLLRSGAFPK
jgi:hypothetical protein